MYNFKLHDFREDLYAAVCHNHRTYYPYISYANPLTATRSCWCRSQALRRVALISEWLSEWVIWRQRDAMSQRQSTIDYHEFLSLRLPSLVCYGPSDPCDQPITRQLCQKKLTILTPYNGHFTRICLNSTPLCCWTFWNPKSENSNCCQQ